MNVLFLTFITKRTINRKINLGDSSKTSTEGKTAAVKPSVSTATQGTSAVIAPKAKKSKHVWVNPSIAAATTTTESTEPSRRPEPAVLPPILPSVGKFSKVVKELQGLRIEVFVDYLI